MSGMKISPSRKTKLIVVDPVAPNPAELAEAAVTLRAGGTVAFPTETVYGLGANALDPEAVRKIFVAKGRPADNPLIVHIARREDVEGLVAPAPAPGTLVSGAEILAAVERLMDRFWPGPLTLVLPRGPRVPEVVTAGLPSVAIRMPAHPVALELIAASGVPVAAPSANLSGKPSPTTAAHVLADMDGRIDVIVDGGAAGVGVESTVLDLTAPVPTVLRPGGVTFEALVQVLGDVQIDSALAGEALVGRAWAGEGYHGESELRPRSPGMKYTHYAPEAEMIVVEEVESGEAGRAAEKVWVLAAEAMAAGRRVGIMATEENSAYYAERSNELLAPLIKVTGSRRRPESIATGLYGALREFDAAGVELIVAEGVPVDGIGRAIMNRLRKAAGYRIVRV